MCNGKETRWQQGKKKGDKGWQDKQQGNQYLIKFDGHYAVLLGYFWNCKHKRGRFMLKTSVFEKATHHLRFENAHIHQFGKRNFLKTQNQTFAFMSFCPKTRIFVPKMWGQTGALFNNILKRVFLSISLVDYRFSLWGFKKSLVDSRVIFLNRRVLFFVIK